MSDVLYKIIPTDPFCRLQEPLLQACADNLAANMICDSISVVCGDTPAFVDCGGELDRIACPVCGSELTFENWSEAMEQAYRDGFRSLTTRMACCGQCVSLNDLDYHLPCGFACCEIDILNPEASCSGRLLEAVQEILGVTVRVIKAYI